MLNVDLATFWEKDETSREDNCFSLSAKQVSMGIRMSDECVFAELGEEGNPWGDIPRERRIELNTRYNDKAERIVGIRLLNENPPKQEELLPGITPIGEIFGGRYEFNGNSTWLCSDIKTAKELELQLDKIDRMDMREQILPPDWEKEKKRVFELCGRTPDAFGGIRGPVTLAMSIFGAENLIFLILDEPELAKRFSDTIWKVIKAYIDIMDKEAGVTIETRPHAFGFNDDDCCLLTPEMYEFFGYPILKSAFDYVSPKIEHQRYQHSDSAMGHLLPILSRLNLTGCNFGPTVMIDEIRKYMPRTRIDGQIAPFTFMRNNESDIIAEVKRDCTLAKKCGRGVNLSTAGSINNGSLLTSMRSVMWGIQEYGQYE